jgi:hypothetical protein
MVMNTPETPDRRDDMGRPEDVGSSDDSVCGAAFDSAQLTHLVDLWKHEHDDLIKQIHQTTLWLGEVSQLGIPKFGELAERLQALRTRMLRHFDHENELGEDLQQVCDCVEVTATRRSTSADHQNLTNRIDELVAKLDQPDPPFESFQQAIDQVGLLVDAFEQHEEQEAQGLQWLAINNSDPRRAPR